jgi:scyllo-inositol 2-dehydrogenase (NADP+)
MSGLPIRTALLSYGMSGEVFHAPLLSSLEGFHLTKIVQRKADHAKQRYPGVTVVRSSDDVMADPSIELVVVNTPNESHFMYAKTALENRKHVIVEKPFTVTTAEADELIALAGQNSVTLSVFQNRRWDSDFLTVKKVLAGGRLGKIVEFEAHYDRFRNYIETGTWKEEDLPGTGILYNLGSHMLDQVVVLFGMPQYVDARLGIQRPDGKVNDFYDIRMEYASHLVIVKSSYLVKEPMPRYIIHGVNGSFVKFGLDQQEQALKDKRIPSDESWGTEDEQFWGKLNVVENGTSREERVRPERGDYRAYYRNIYEVIRNGQELSVTPQQARDVIRLIEACMESNITKSSIKIS